MAGRKPPRFRSKGFRKIEIGAMARAMTAPIDSPDGTRVPNAARMLDGRFLCPCHALVPQETSKKKTSPGGQRNPLKRLISDKEIQVKTKLLSLISFDFPSSGLGKICRWLGENLLWLGKSNRRSARRRIGATPISTL
jgi:hypothetical protein